MSFTITIEQDGSGYMDLVPFDWMTRRAKEAINGPIALRGEPKAGTYFIDERDAERFFVRKSVGSDERVLDFD